jgi:hypothetical protein
VPAPILGHTHGTDYWEDQHHDMLDGTKIGKQCPGDCDGAWRREERGHAAAGGVSEHGGSKPRAWRGERAPRWGEALRGWGPDTNAGSESDSSDCSTLAAMGVEAVTSLTVNAIDATFDDMRAQQESASVPVIVRPPASLSPGKRLHHQRSSRHAMVPLSDTSPHPEG